MSLGDMFNKGGKLLSPDKLKEGALIRKKTDNTKGLVRMIDSYIRENEMTLTEMKIAFATMETYFTEAAHGKYLLPKRDAK